MPSKIAPLIFAQLRLSRMSGGRKLLCIVLEIQMPGTVEEGDWDSSLWDKHQARQI